MAKSNMELFIVYFHRLNIDTYSLRKINPKAQYNVMGTELPMLL